MHWGDNSCLDTERWLYNEKDGTRGGETGDMGQWGEGM
jgi:hypothetical protein